VTESGCNLRSHYIHFQVEKETGIITACSQTASHEKISLTSPTTLVTNRCERSFDCHGQPTVTTECTICSKKIGESLPRREWKTTDGKPLYPLFVQYLKEHGMTDRIPDPPPESPQKAETNFSGEFIPECDFPAKRRQHIGPGAENK
jgi:hypothetical protein